MSERSETFVNQRRRSARHGLAYDIVSYLAGTDCYRIVDENGKAAVYLAETIEGDELIEDRPSGSMAAYAFNARMGSGQTVAPEKVDHPSHYGGASNVYEAIKVIRAWALGFALGNAVKYIARAGKKAGESALDDLKKARWYIDNEIAVLEAEEARLAAEEMSKLRKAE